MDASGGRAAEHQVDDGHDVGEALAGPGPGGDDVVAACASGTDGLGLVAVKTERAAGVFGVGLAAKNPLALLVEEAFPDEIVDQAAGLEGWIEREVRLGPEETGVERTIDRIPDVGVENCLKAADELGVASDQAVAKLERVHLSSVAKMRERRELPRSAPQGMEADTAHPAESLQSPR